MPLIARAIRNANGGVDRDSPATCTSPGPSWCSRAISTSATCRPSPAAFTRADQSLPDLDAAIRVYTINTADLMRQEGSLGSLERNADLIVLDRNIFEVPPGTIGGTKVLLTLVGGEEVWRSPSF